MAELYLINDQKIQSNIAKMKHLCDGEKNVIVKIQWPSPWEGFNQIRCFDDFEYEYNFYLRQYNMDSEAADLGFDNIPYFREDFGRVAYLQSIAYGCEIVRINGLINSKPLIYNAEDCYKIKKPDIINAGFYPEIERRMKEIERRLGDVYFVPGDVQSPIDVLTEIFYGEDCMCAMYDEPEPLHYLLNMLTETIAEILQHQKSIVKNMVGYGHDHPIPYGVHLSDDNAAFLSPSTYEEFALPYNSKLSEIFGGVTLHCCMNYRHNLKSMVKTKGFLGFDPQTKYNPSDMIMDAFAEADNGFWNVWDMPYEIDKTDYCKQLIDMTDEKCGLILNISAGSKDEALKIGCDVKNYVINKNRN